MLLRVINPIKLFLLSRFTTGIRPVFPIVIFDPAPGIQNGAVGMGMWQWFILGAW